MKKLLYLFIASAFLISCESNEDDMSNTDPIIGTWQLESVIEDGEEQTTSCERRTTLTFLENGVTTANSYFNDGNGCESESDSSSWENIGDSNYRIDSDDESIKIDFSQNNTVFSSTFSETFDGMTFTTVITYKKI